ncbi:hypothetical protein [Terasakiella sp. SH-1]|uniref:hypothetical protein n=1 Tax=Terasakiella sp. SH-1 TaxID=2560057 RepID=UPI0010731856|nr:hypothetical protein [Terasakiella sp. SH-1]
MSGPMALLPPTAKYLLWNSNDKPDEESRQPISVQDLLKNARKFSTKSAPPAKIEIAYDDYTLTDDKIEAFIRLNSLILNMTCGPYEYGSPLNAATMALRTCGAIKRQLTDRGLKLNVQFDPEGPKGKAILIPVTMREGNDA